MSDSRVALVTGASRGIGRAIAARLAGEGCFVVGTATSDSGVETINDLLGDRGFGIVMQVQDGESVAGALEQAEQKQGPISILVNNAGVTRDNLLMRMSEEQWTDVIDTNLNALYRLCKPLLRGMMKARWGRIVNLSSVVGRMGNPGQSNYAASKAGIEGFTRALSQEVGSRGITVNCVAPGFIATDMTADLDEKQTETMVSQIPLGRMGTAEDVAQAVAFLVGEEAGYITGETIHVNGGLFVA